MSVKKEALMDGGLTSGLAAVTGAFVGGLASLMSTWLGERSRHRRDLLQREIVKRETIYSDFIDQASKLYVASATRQIEDDDAELEGVVTLYAVASRLRLFANDQVTKEAEKVVDQIIMQYGAENVSAEQLRESAFEKKDDPLKAFSIICRGELQYLHRGM
jgi:5'(3')-deoxyribonucleotidase